MTPSYELSVPGELVQELFSGSEGVAKLLEAILNQVLSAQAAEQLGAAPYERTEGRQGYRAGSRTRTLVTRVGALELKVPHLRGAPFSTELFARFQRSEQALLVTVMEMFINGVSTRHVGNVLEEMCGVELSKSTVSELCKRLDPLVRAWNERDLSGRAYPFLLVDALVLKVREDGRVRARSLFIVTGIGAEGMREVLGVMVGDSESEASWRAVFAGLKRRGLRGLDLVVSDSHAGLVKAIEAEFQGATWQRCQTHLTRNLCDACPKAVWPELHPRLRHLFTAPDMPTARQLLADILRDFAARAPKAMALLEAAFEDAMAVMALPAPIRKRLRTTNGAERLNREVRRRERAVGIFPNRDSAIRLLGAVLMEIDEDWSVGKRYLDLTDYWARRNARPEAADTNPQGAPIAESQAA
jgi:putative transposase